MGQRVGNRGAGAAGASGTRRRLVLVSLTAALAIGIGAGSTTVGAQDRAGEPAPKTITIGESNTEAQRTELLADFGATEDDRVTTVTVADTAAAMDGIYDLAGVDSAYSSTALACRVAGGGLTVTTRNIEIVGPDLFALALVTAGIGDAELTVAAPAEDAALGMTALAGVFQTWDLAACSGAATDPDRQRLALETIALAVAIGQEQAPDDSVIRATRLVLAAQQAIVTGDIADPAAIGRVVTIQAAASGVLLDDTRRADLVDLLARLAAADLDWGAYAGGWTISRDPVADRVTMTGRPRAAAPSDPARGAARTGVGGVVALPTPVATTAAAASPAATPRPGPTATPPAPFGTVRVDGTALDRRDGLLVIREDGDDRAVAFAVGAAEVVRNGTAADFGDVRASDRVTLLVEMGTGAVRRLDARSGPPLPTGDPPRRWGWLVPLGLIALAALLFARRRPRRLIPVRATARVATALRFAAPREPVRWARGHGFARRARFRRGV